MINKLIKLVLFIFYVPSEHPTLLPSIPDFKFKAKVQQYEITSQHELLATPVIWAPHGFDSLSGGAVKLTDIFSPMPAIRL